MMLSCSFMLTDYGSCNYIMNLTNTLLCIIVYVFHTFMLSYIHTCYHTLNATSVYLTGVVWWVLLVLYQSLAPLCVCALFQMLRRLKDISIHWFIHVSRRPKEPSSRVLEDIRVTTLETVVELWRWLCPLLAWWQPGNVLTSHNAHTQGTRR